MQRLDIKRWFDDWSLFPQRDIEGAFRVSLQQIFDLPLASEIKVPKDTDLVLDVAILKYQLGFFSTAHFGDLSIPILWRPKIEVIGRLYQINSGQNVHIAAVVTKMPIKDYVARLFAWATLIGWWRMVDAPDMSRLLEKGCMKLLHEFKIVM